MNWNTNRELSSFEKDITTIRKHGYKPIAVCQMYFEDTFVFETDEEAKEAFDELEKGNKVQGWWYGKKDFLKTVEEYETKSSIGEGTKVKIYWL